MSWKENTNSTRNSTLAMLSFRKTKLTYFNKIKGKNERWKIKKKAIIMNKEFMKNETLSRIYKNTTLT